MTEEVTLNHRWMTLSEILYYIRRRTIENLGSFEAILEKLEEIFRKSFRFKDYTLLYSLGPYSDSIFIKISVQDYYHIVMSITRSILHHSNDDTIFEHFVRKVNHKFIDDFIDKVNGAKLKIV